MTAPILWRVAGSHVAVLRGFRNRDAQVLLTLFPPKPAPGQPRGGSTYYPATAGDVLAQHQPLVQVVEGDLQRRPGYSLGLVVNEADQHPEGWQPSPETGRAWGSRNGHINTAMWLFSECDQEGLDQEEQLLLAQRVYGADPSLVIATGGKSLHCYYRLAEPVTAERFTDLQKLVIAVYEHLEPGCSVDRSLAKPAQVMRLAGALHPRTGRYAVIHAASDTVLDPVALEARLQALLPASRPRPVPSPHRPPTTPYGRPGGPRKRTLQDVIAAMGRVPSFASGCGQREQFLRFQAAVRHAVREAGSTDQQALALVQAHSPGVLDAEDYFRTDWTQISAGTLFFMARQEGHS
ncbi:MAG: hypothetical protein ER33_08140 [Cyanobium sp. CACIAM 14]|nr:MAG: hypothetical protein ER33_08140 [Cyanobium sp. CACIAM 14]